MISYLVLLVIFCLSLVRILRWVSVFQQKEYRSDRLLLFLQTAEGKTELYKLFPTLKELSRGGLKRPVRTARGLLLLFLAFFTSLVFYTVAYFVEWGWLWAIAFYVLLPALIVLLNSPSEIVKYFVVEKTITKAKRLLQLGKPMVIGITGSYGKTSSKLLLSHILKQKYSVFCTPKSFNTKYSMPQSIVKNYRNQQIAVLEYAAYTLGEIAFLAKHFPPQIAAITGFTIQHLGLFGSEENIINAKAELVRALPADGRLFCNAADSGVIKICQAGGRDDCIHYSGKKAVVELSEVLVINGLLEFKWKNRLIKTKLIGRHYLDEIQLVIAVAESLDLTSQQIIEGLESFIPDQSFITVCKSKSGAMVINDGFSTNPAGFAAALELLQSFKVSEKRLILLTAGIVDLGQESAKTHTQLAKKASGFLDLVLYAGEIGKEEFKQVFAEKCIVGEQKILEFIDQISDKDVVLLEGRVSKLIMNRLGI